MGPAEETTVTDGERAWYRGTGLAARALEGAALQLTLAEHYGTKFGDWRTFYERVEILRSVTLDGRETIVMRTVAKGGRGSTKFVDARTGELVGEYTFVDVPGAGLVGVRARYADFRDVLGARVPFRRTIEYATRLLGTWVIQIEDVEARAKPPGGAFDPLVAN